MGRQVARECTLEEYEAWVAASKRTRAVKEAADEEGGPGLSLVPVPEQNIAWPTDLLSAEGSGEKPMPFDGVPLESSRKRLAGWSAERQRLFLANLAETGSVHLAASAARLSARSAYQLRARSVAFAQAWNAALRIAVGRLAAIAFDRAVHGRVEQVYRDGNLVAERRVPSDKMLQWLMSRLDPKMFALPWEQRGDSDTQAEALSGFTALLDVLTDESS